MGSWIGMHLVKPLKGAKILDSITRTEYTQEKGVLQKRKVRWCLRRDQQEYYIDKRYSPVLKAPEVRLLTAAAIVGQFAVQQGCNLYKTHPKQGFLYGDMDNADPVYVRPPNWWFGQVPEGLVFRLKKAIYRKKPGLNHCTRKS